MSSLDTVAETAYIEPIKGSSQSWLVCMVAALFFFYEFIQMNMLGSLSKAITQEFSLGSTELAFLSNGYLLANALFIIPAGLILDRCSTRKVILTAIVFCIIGTFGFATAQTALVAAMFHAVSGASNSSCFLACIMLTTRWFPPRQHALVIGSIITIAFMGGMVSQAPLAMLMQYTGSWRNAVMSDGFIGIIIFGLIWTFVRDYPPQVFNAKRFKCPLKQYPNITKVYKHCLKMKEFKKADKIFKKGFK